MSYINFYLPTSNNTWQEFNLLREMSDITDLESELTKYCLNTEYLQNNKLKLSLFPDRVLGQMLCAGTCKHEVLDQYNSVNTLLYNIQSNIFEKSYSYNTLQEYWSDFPEKLDLSIWINVELDGISDKRIRIIMKEHDSGNQYDDYTVSQIQLPDLNIIIDSTNISEYISKQFIINTIDTNIKSQLLLFFNSIYTFAKWTPNETKDLILSEASRKSNTFSTLNLSAVQDYYISPITNSVIVNSGKILILSNLDCPAVFFNMIVDESGFFMNTPYLTGDWCIPLISKWSLISNIATIQSINDNTTGSISLYGGICSTIAANGGAFNKGYFYYNDKYNSYEGVDSSNISDSPLTNCMVLCTQSVSASNVVSDSTEGGYVTPNFSKYFHTPQMNLNNPCQVPYSQGEVVATTSINTILHGLDKWNEFLTKFITGASEYLPIYNPNTLKVEFKTVPTWGRRLICNVTSGEPYTQASSTLPGSSKGYDFCIVFKTPIE